MRLPLKMMVGGALLVAVALAGVLAVPRGTEADVVAGQFSVELDVTDTGPITTGNTFNLDVLVEHNGAIPYQAAQWFVDYDEALVDVTDTTLTAAEIRDPAAPTNCAQASDNTLRVLLGCIDVIGPNLTYSGVVWSIEFTCIAAGTANFGLGTIGTQTYVRTDLVTNATVHTHTDSIDCTGTALPTDTPVPPTNTPIPATNTATPLPSNTPLTAPSASPTRAPREPFTETPEPTETPLPGTTTPGEPTTPPGNGGAVSSPTRTGTGGTGAGGLRPPDTGSGPQEGSSALLLVIFGGMAAAGVALFGAGAVAARRSR